MPVADRVQLTAKADRSVQDQGLETLAAEVNVDFTLFDGWSVQAGARHERREDESNVSVAAVTQKRGSNGCGRAGGLRLQGALERLRLRTGDGPVLWRS